MSINASKKLHRLQAGALPLIHAIAKRMRLKEILLDYMPLHGNEDIPAVDTLIMLVYNLVLGKEPLYNLSGWISKINTTSIGYNDFEIEKFNDDRFGRALDKLYAIDRASLQTDIVVQAIESFGVKLDRIHNDSTSVKAYGKYPGTTPDGFELKRGKSKDHRPDLKQLVYSLSISADGAIPVHCKVYSGNRTDDTTHIETWETLYRLTKNANFIYVADCKLCTDAQLSHIVSKGGTAITLIPKSWGEVKIFMEELRKTKKSKKEIWRREKPNHEGKTEYFSVYTGDYKTETRGYQVHWIYSSEKKERDRDSREQALKKAEYELMLLNAKINKKNLKTKDKIQDAITAILNHRKVTKFINIEIGETKEQYKVQVGKGRPGKNTKYIDQVDVIYTMTWRRNKPALQEESNVDGVFPLLCTDNKITAKNVLQAYKYQPRLEKRFMQFKSVHNAAPLLFKNITRVEANMFLFFIALIIQALLEREIRTVMKQQNIESLDLYPEDREALHPTTDRVLKIFEGISSYKITKGEEIIEEYKDDFEETHKLILNLMNIKEVEYWMNQRA